MTDNEIIKALECCSQTHDCRECVLLEMHSAQCVSDLLSNALSLIKSQNAEIERLKAEADMADGYADALEERARIEAIKEFVERLKAESILRSGCVPWYDIQETVDNLAKEMTEDGK